MNNKSWLEKEVGSEVYEKTKKNVLWVSIIAIVMLFAGLSSAYVVSMADTFWVKITMPRAFWISTILVILGSFTLWLAAYFAKKDKKKAILYSLVVTLVLGAAFTWSQFKGWGEMIEKGNYFTSNVVNFYAYGKHYTILYNGEEITYDGEHFLLDGNKLDASIEKEMREFLIPVYEVGYKFQEKKYNLPEYGKFTIATKPELVALTLQEGKFYKEGEALSVVENLSLLHFARAVSQGYGYFNLAGEYGKDFVINLFGEELDYKKGRMYFKSRPLGDKDFEMIDATFNDIDANSYTFKNGEVKDASGNPVGVERLAEMGIVFPHKGWSIAFRDGKWYREVRELNENEYSALAESRNTASSFIYIFTVLHLLHLIGGWFYLIYLLSGALKKKYGIDNHLQLRLGGIYWHFLGGLWVYLFLFFQFIH